MSFYCQKELTMLMVVEPSGPMLTVMPPTCGSGAGDASSDGFAILACLAFGDAYEAM